MKSSLQNQNQPSMNADLTSATTANRKTGTLLRLGIMKKIKSLLMDFSIICYTSAREKDPDPDSFPGPSNRVHEAQHIKIERA